MLKLLFPILALKKEGLQAMFIFILGLLLLIILILLLLIDILLVKIWLLFCNFDSKDNWYMKPTGTSPLPKSIDNSISFPWENNNPSKKFRKFQLNIFRIYFIWGTK